MYKVELSREAQRFYERCDKPVAALEDFSGLTKLKESDEAGFGAARALTPTRA